jgi:guanine nucleotide-binding protein subunit alpha
MGSLSIHMFDIGGQQSDKRKWIHQFENVTSIIFSVDISCYDQVLLEESNQNRVVEQLVQFDSVVNSRWFMHTSIILLFCNVEIFKHKLTRKPMHHYFPDYTGGDDINKASQYLLWRFNQLNRSHLNLYPHLCETSDFSSVRLVFSAIKETILQNALKSSSIPDRTTLLLREKEAIRKDAGYGKKEVIEEIDNGNDEKGKDVEERLNAP